MLVSSVPPPKPQMAFTASQSVVSRTVTATGLSTVLGAMFTRQRALLSLSMRLTESMAPLVTVRFASTISGVRPTGSGANASSKPTDVSPSWLAGRSAKVATIGC